MPPFHTSPLCPTGCSQDVLSFRVTWRGFYFRLMLREVVREWLLWQVRHAGNWNALPEEESCHAANITAVLVGRLNPCDGREWLGKRGCWDWLSSASPEAVLWQSTGTFKSKRLVSLFLLSAAWCCANHGKICNSFYTGSWCGVGRQQQAVTTESWAFLAASGQAGSSSVWTGCSNVFRQVSVCLFPNINVQSSYLPQMIDSE